MSRTVKQEYSKPDGWHITKRLERKARPAGRIQRLVAQELAAIDPDAGLGFWLDRYMCEEQGRDWQEEYDEWCGCYCRRCLLHGDHGGCLYGHGED